MAEMQTGVFAFVVVDVNRDLLEQVEGLSIGRFKVLQIGGKDVFVFTGRNALGELAAMIGIDFPSNLLGFIRSTANSHRDAENGPVIGTPDRTKDKRIWLVGFLRRQKTIARNEARENEKNSKKS